MPRKAQAAGAATVMPYTLQTLAVRGIRVLDEVQPRSYLDDQVIKEYATLYQEADGDDPLPPIDVFTVEGKHYVSDGFHRLAAAKAAKRAELACHVYPGSLQDAVRHGIFANLRRGLAYSRHDRERILERLLHDPEVSQQSDRALARALGLSHVTVGRARHRLAALDVLEDEWRVVPVTQTKEDARHQEQFATFLGTAPAVVASYEKIISEPLTKERILPWVARRMTDANESEEQAKTAVVQQLHDRVKQEESQREIRRKYRTPRPPKETPEQQAAREAERQRREREHYLLDHIKSFVGLQDGREYMFVLKIGYTLLDMVAALSPENVQQLPELLSQAEAVIRTLKDALASRALQEEPRP